MKAKVYIGAKKYAVYIGRKIVEKTMNFFSFPARFFATKDGALKDYKMYGNTVQSNLPEGYVQLESISSTGYEYINTGLVIQSGDEIQLDYEWLGDTPSSLSADMMFFGCQNIDTTVGGVWAELYRRSDGSHTWYARMGATSSTGVAAATEQITGRHLLSLSQIRLALDGEILFRLSTSDTFQTTPLTLFGRYNQTGTTLNSSRIKVFGFKVINNGVVRLNLIPCKNADNILGMYDTVTKQFLINSGTGEFIAGNAIGLPEGYTQLEYIVADGNAYVDTGFKANTTTTRFVGAFRLTDTRVSQGFFGSRNGNTANESSCMIAFVTGENFVRLDWVNGASSFKIPVTGNTIITTDVTRGYSVINGTEKTSTISTSVDQIHNFYVGHFRNGDGTMFISGVIGHIFPCQLISNGVVIRNFVPAKRNSDEKIGMYDIENNVFYPSAGESEFTAGPVFSLKPTPTNPIAIESVGDRTVNLFNKETITKGKYISQAGAVTSSASFCYGDYISVVPNTDYIISGTNKGGTAYRRVHAYDADQKWLRQIKALQVTSGADYTMTFTVPEDCVYIRFSGMSSTNDYEETNIVQIQEGSVVTEYESYGYKIPVNVANKNMLNPNAEVYNGYIGLMNVGEAIRYGSSTASKTYKKFAYFKPGTYTYSYNGSASTGSLRFVLCDENEIVREIVSTPVVQGRNEVTVNFTKEGWGYVSALVVATDIQIEEGDTATAYEPYFNQTTNVYLSEPLRKLGDYADYIDYAEQKVVRNIKEVSGVDLTFAKGRFGTNSYYATIPNPLVLNEAVTIISNYFAGKSYDDRTSTEYNFVYIQDNTTLYLRNTTYTTLGDAKNKFIFDYVLATQTEESITLPAIALQQGNLSMDVETKIKPSQLTITGDIDDVR